MLPLKQRRRTMIAIAALLLVGAALVFGRSISMRQGGAPAGDEFWRLHIDATFDAESAGARLSLPYPLETDYARATALNINPDGLRYRTRRAPRAESAALEFEAYAAGRGSIDCWFDIHLRQAPWALAARRLPPSGELQAAMLKNTPDIDARFPEVEAVAQILKARADDKRQLLDAIHRFCINELIADSEGADLSQNVVSERRGSELGIARTMVALCRSGGISARVVRGFWLEEPIGDESLEVASVVEVWIGDTWRSFVPTRGHRDTLPRNFLPMRATSGPLAQATGGTVAIAASVQRQPPPEGMLGAEGKSVWQVFDLTRMPLEAQAMFVHLLLLPFGALVVTLSHNLLGIRSFGVFSPPLMAMSLLYVDPKLAGVVFAVTLCVGVAGRAMLPGLKLMRMPRLSVVFTMVAMVMALCLSVLAYMGAALNGQLLLLPTVVLTTIIDRFYTVADEDGTPIAMRRLSWTLILAVACAMVFQWSALGRLVLHFPEVHLFTITGLIVAGLYSGRQLCDAPGFQLLAEPKRKKLLAKEGETAAAAPPPSTAE